MIKTKSLNTINLEFIDNCQYHILNCNHLFAQHCIRLPYNFKNKNPLNSFQYYRSLERLFCQFEVHNEKFEKEVMKLFKDGIFNIEKFIQLVTTFFESRYVGISFDKSKKSVIKWIDIPCEFSVPVVKITTLENPLLNFISNKLTYNYFPIYLENVDVYLESLEKISKYENILYCDKKIPGHKLHFGNDYLGYDEIKMLTPKLYDDVLKCLEINNIEYDYIKYDELKTQTNFEDNYRGVSCK